MSALKRPALVGSLLVRKGAATATRVAANAVAPEIVRVTPRPVVSLPNGPHLTATPVASPKVVPVKRFGRQQAKSATSPMARRSGKKMRLTLGLDADVHLKLKLAAVHNGTNMRSLILTAIDQHLEALAPAIQGGRCACLQSGKPKGSCGHNGTGPVDGKDQH